MLMSVNYIDKKLLRSEMESYLATGIISPELTVMLNNIVSGVVVRYGANMDREEVRQNCWLLFLRHLNKINPEKNAFSYLTSMVRNCMRAMKRGFHNDLEKLYRAFAESCSLGTISQGDKKYDDE